MVENPGTSYDIECLKSEKRIYLKDSTGLLYLTYFDLRIMQVDEHKV